MSANLELQYRAVKMARNSSSEILHFIVMLLWSYVYVYMFPEKPFRFIVLDFCLFIF